MDPHIKQEWAPFSKKVSKAPSPESIRRYLLSFFWMTLFTALAFILVDGQYLIATATIWVIIILAVIQVFLQLFTFMHLDQEEYTIPVLFMAIGSFVAIISVIGIILM
jgi:cytochrome c oxidase subunit IV